MPVVKQKNPRDERRARARLPKVAPAMVRVFDSAGTTLSLSAETRDIHSFGVCLEASGPDHFPANAGTRGKYFIQLEGQQLPASLVWRSGARCGFRFAKEFSGADLVRQSGPAAPLKKFLLWVGGRDVDTGNYDYFPRADKLVLDPAQTLSRISALKKGQVPDDAAEYVSARYAVGDAQLNRQAIEAAHEAFLKFRDFPLERRCQIVIDVCKRMQREKETLIKLMMDEGHPRKLAEWEFEGMSIGGNKKSVEYFRSEALKTIAQDNGETLIAVRRPDGVLCVCPPANASCSNSMTALLALIVGNTLVVKPPLACPVSTLYLWRDVIGPVLEKHGAPPGTVNLVLGNSKEFMDEWLENPLVRGVLFFHDSGMGLEIGRKLYAKGKKPILELAGNDFMAIWRDAPLEAATDALLEAFLGSTQICMVPKKAVIHADIYDRFVEVFLRKVRGLTVGLPSDPKTILSPVMRMKEYFDCLRDALDQGGRLLTGGDRVDHRGEKSATGAYIAPSVIEIPAGSAQLFKCVREENFFPLLPLIKVDAEGDSPRQRDSAIFDRMKDLLEKNEYGLRLSAWVASPYYLNRIISEFHYSGILRINSRHVGFSSYISTHGGIGKTGGPFGEMNHVWQKSSHLQGISITHLDRNPGK